MCARAGHKRKLDEILTLEQKVLENMNLNSDGGRSSSSSSSISTSPCKKSKVLSIADMISTGYDSDVMTSDELVGSSPCQSTAVVLRDRISEPSEREISDDAADPTDLDEDDLSPLDIDYFIISLKDEKNKERPITYYKIPMWEFGYLNDGEKELVKEAFMDPLAGLVELSPDLMKSKKRAYTCFILGMLGRRLGTEFEFSGQHFCDNIDNCSEQAHWKRGTSDAPEVVNLILTGKCTILNMTMELAYAKQNGEF